MRWWTAGRMPSAAVALVLISSFYSAPSAGTLTGLVPGRSWITDECRMHSALPGQPHMMYQWIVVTALAEGRLDWHELQNPDGYRIDVWSTSYSSTRTRIDGNTMRWRFKIPVQLWTDEVVTLSEIRVWDVDSQRWRWIEFRRPLYLSKSTCVIP